MIRKSAFIVSACACAFGVPLHAASIYWNGVGTEWTDVLNWSTAAAATTPNPAAVPGSADTAIFNISTVPGPQTINLSADQSVLGLQILASATGATTISSATGNSLTIGTGGITITAASSNASTFSANLIVNGNQTWTTAVNPGAGVNNISGNVSGTGNLTLAGTQRWAPAATSTLSLNGSLTISSANSDLYSNFLNGASGGVIFSAGNTGIQGATFNVDKNITFSGNTNWYMNGAGQTASLTGSVNGGTVTFQPNNTSGSLTLGGATNNAGLNVGVGGGVFTVNLAKASSPFVHAVGGNFTMGTNNTVQITGTGGDQILDTGGVTMNAATAKFDLNGNSETIGSLTGNNATAAVTNTAASTSSTLTLGANNNSVTFAGSIQNGASGTGVVSLTKIGTGTQTLTGANTYTGATTVNRGTLTLDFSAANPASVINSTSALVLGGGILGIKGKAAANGATVQTVNGLTLNNGASGLTINANGANTTVLNLGAITRSPGATVNFTLPAGTQSATNGYTTSQTNTGGTILSGWATVGGTDWASTSAGNVVSAAGSYTNDTWAAGTNTTVTASTSPADSSTTNSLRFAQGAQTVTLSGTNVITTGGILVSSGIGNNASTITGGSITSGDGESVYIQQFNTTNSTGLTIASAIVNNGATPTAITKAGGGAVTLSGTNTATGALNVNSGTVNITGANASLSTINVNSGTLNLNSAGAFTNGAPVNISNGGTVNVASASALGNGNNAVILSGGSTLVFANTGAAVTLPTLTTAWQSSSNWNGTPSALATGGRFQPGAGSPGAAQPDFFLVDLGADYNLGQISMTLGNTYRNLTFYTAPSSAGAFTDMFVANGNSAASPSTLNLGLFTADSANFVSATDPATGAFSFGLSGVTGRYFAMYVTQRVANNYSFDISTGITLSQVASAAAKSIGSLAGDALSTVNIGGNLTLTTGGNNTSTAFAGVVAGSGALVKTGTGTQTLSNANTYTGGTTITQGTLKVNNITGSGTGTGAVLVNGGTLAGNGIISGAITLTSGTVAPGDGLGTLSGSTLVWNGGAGMSFDLSNVDSASDRLSLSGALTKGTGSGFVFNFGGTGTSATYTLATFGSTTFSQSDFGYANLGGGYSGSFLLTGNTLSLVVVSVPEPANYGLAVGALLGARALLRRRRKAAA